MDKIDLSRPGAGFFTDAQARAVLEREILPRYLPHCRWFGGKARQPERFRVEEIVALGAEEEALRLVLVRVEYPAGPADTYLLPLQLGHGGAEAIATFSDGLSLSDAIGNERFRSALLALIAGGGVIEADGLTLRGERGRALPEGAETLPSRVLKVEQSNSSLLFGDRIFVKLFRKLEDGINPDVEITRFLHERQRFEHVPPFAGTVELHRPGREPQVLALALGLIANEGDAWAHTLGEVREFYTRVLPSGVSAAGLALPGLFADGLPSPALLELAGAFTTRVRQLGVRTGQTHLALAAETGEPDFAPEPFTADDQRELSEAVRTSARKTFSLLRAAPSRGGPAKELLAREPEVLALAETIAHREVRTMKTRTHGDYHLGQVLNTGDDYVLIDFEGEPQRPLAERKKKRSPLRDVAGMLRSFHYAAHSGLGDFEAQREALEPWAELWAGLMSRNFLQAWLETCAGAVFLPKAADEIELLLKSFLLEKAIYELGYELNNRPTWVEIPIRGILQILEA